MLIKKITSVGNSAAVLLSKDLLALLNVEIGDEVEIKIVDDALILRSTKSQQRSEKFNQSAKRVLEKRRSALARLAQGQESKSDQG